MKGELGNIVGPQIRKLRYDHAWSQAKLAVKLQLAGFDISRESLAKVEIQIHKVEDYQLPYYARALGVSLHELFPPLPPDKPINDVVAALRVRRNGAASRTLASIRNGAPSRVETPRERINEHARLHNAPSQPSRRNR